MTIPTALAWPLGCLCAIGAVHAGFAIESAILTMLRALTKGITTWR